MRNALPLPRVALLLVAAAIVPALAQIEPGLQAPVAKREPHTDEDPRLHAKDDYFWLREKANPDVIAYLEAENAYTEAVMRPTKPLQETLYKEMLGRIKQTDLSVPSRIGEYFYYSRTEEGQAVPVHVPPQGQHGRRRRNPARPQRARRGPQVPRPRRLRRQRRRQLAGVLARHDRLPAVQPAREGSAHGAATRRTSIERVGSVVWATDNKTLFYTTEDAVSKRSDKVCRHVVGQRPAS